MTRFYTLAALVCLLTSFNAGAQNGFDVQVLTRGAANPHVGTPAGYQHVVVKMTANRRVPLTGTGNWGSASFTMRVPKTLSPSPIANPTANSTQILNASSGISDLNMVSFISGSVTDIRTFDGPTSGTPEDGYVYWQFQNSAATTGKSYNAGQSFTLVEFDIPGEWGCTNCMQVTTTAMAPPVMINNGLNPAGILNLSEGGTNQNQFSLVQNNQPLPVKLSSFTAVRTNDSRARINWATAEEQNVDYFEIQRALDGKNFTTVITTVKAKGNSTDKQEYLAFDNAPVNGTNYYRLKSVDNGGASSFSEIRTVNFDGIKNSYSLSPNPANDIVTVKGMTGTSVIRVLNTLGQLQSEMKASDAAATINVNNLPAGMYYLQVTENDQVTYNQKFVKE